MQPLVGAQRAMQPDRVVQAGDVHASAIRQQRLDMAAERGKVEPPVGEIGEGGSVQMGIVAETMLQTNPEAKARLARIEAQSGRWRGESEVDRVLGPEAVAAGALEIAPQAAGSSVRRGSCSGSSFANAFGGAISCAGASIGKANETCASRTVRPPCCVPRTCRDEKRLPSWNGS